MKKPATTETSCQPQVAIQLPLPLLSRLKAVKEGFFDLCVRVGEQPLHALMEQDRTELCGAKWSRDPSRIALRGGSTSSEITLGGRRVSVRRLQASTVDGQELVLPSFAWAADRDPLDEQTWRSIVAGVSTRSYAGSLDPLPDELQERSTSSSSVSRRFVALSQRQLTKCLSRPLGELDLWVVMIDGIDYRDHSILVAMGIDSSGKKHVLGVREGTTENRAVAEALLSDLVDRGLPTDHPLLEGWLDDPPLGRFRDPRSRKEVPSRSRLSRDVNVDRRAEESRRRQGGAKRKKRRVIQCVSKEPSALAEISSERAIPVAVRGSLSSGLLMS